MTEKNLTKRKCLLLIYHDNGPFYEKVKKAKQKGWTCVSQCLFLFHCAVIPRFPLLPCGCAAHVRSPQTCSLCLQWPSLRVKEWPTKIHSQVIIFEIMWRKAGKFRQKYDQLNLICIIPRSTVFPRRLPRPSASAGLWIENQWKLCRKGKTFDAWIVSMNISSAISKSKRWNQDDGETLTNISFFMLTAANSTLGVWRADSAELVMLIWLLFSSSL